MIVAGMPGLVLRGVLFALLACSLLVNPTAPPAAYYEDDEPFEEVDDEAAASERGNGGSAILSSADPAESGTDSAGSRDG